MERHGERRRTRPRCSGPEDNTPGGTDACAREVRWEHEQAARLELALDEEEVAPQDEGDQQALRTSLLTALAACWPEFSVAEVRRLTFLVYRRATGHIHSPTPLRAAGTHLAAEIASYLRSPPPLAPPPQDAAVVGMPLLWRAWLDAQGLPRRWQGPWEAFE
jgi:hypothetical protein